MSLSDTTGGKMFFSVGGTVVTHVGASAVAVNYRATSGKLAFQLLGRYAPSGSTLQRVEITLPDSVIAADTTFAIEIGRASCRERCRARGRPHRSTQKQLDESKGLHN